MHPALITAFGEQRNRKRQPITWKHRESRHLVAGPQAPLYGPAPS